MNKAPIISLALGFTVSLFAMHASAADVSYADFVESCKNPTAYGHQRPPQNIRISCKDVKKTWEAIEAGSTTLAESRQIAAELFSDKDHVALENFLVALPEFNVACPRYREVIATAQIEQAYTCAQVIAETRSLKEICVDAINEATAENPDLIETADTGRTFGVCEGTGQKP